MYHASKAEDVAFQADPIASSEDGKGLMLQNWAGHQNISDLKDASHLRIIVKVVYKSKLNTVQPFKAFVYFRKPTRLLTSKVLNLIGGR